MSAGCVGLIDAGGVPVPIGDHMAIGAPVGAGTVGVGTVIGPKNHTTVQLLRPPDGAALSFRADFFSIRLFVWSFLLSFHVVA
jgi:hypothetical protein